MFKFKKFRGLLLIVVLAMIFTMQLETNAGAGTPVISGTSVFLQDPVSWCDSFKDACFCYYYDGASDCLFCEAFPEDCSKIDGGRYCYRYPNACRNNYPQVYCYTYPNDSFCTDYSACPSLTASASLMSSLSSVSLMSEVPEGCCANEDPPDCFNYPPPTDDDPLGYFLCGEAVLNRLKNVNKNETVLEFSIESMSLSYENDNSQCNANNANGTAHVSTSGRLTKSQYLTTADVEKNGTADVTQCFSYDEIDSAVQEAVLPNPGWYSCWWNLLSFDVNFILSQDDGTVHKILATCSPIPDTCDDNGADWDCTVYYDSLND